MLTQVLSPETVQLYDRSSQSLPREISYAKNSVIIEKLGQPQYDPPPILLCSPQSSGGG